MSTGLPFDPHLAEAGLKIGAQVFDSQRKAVESIFSRWFGQSSLKSYFNVTNSYVRAKLGFILFPFRSPSSAQDRDIHAPDLYIPLMALVTYMLLCGFLLASFDAVSLVASKSLVLLCLETLVLKGVYYVFVAPDASVPVSILDFAALGGNKFLGLCVASCVRWLTDSNSIYLMAMCYLAVAMAAFMVVSLRRRCAFIAANTVTAPSHSMNGQGMARRYFLLAAGALQVPVMVYLGAQSDHLMVST